MRRGGRERERELRVLKVAGLLSLAKAYKEKLPIISQL